MIDLFAAGLKVDPSKVRAEEGPSVSTHRRPSIYSRSSHGAETVLCAVRKTLLTLHRVCKTLLDTFYPAFNASGLRGQVYLNVQDGATAAEGPPPERLMARQQADAAVLAKPRNPPAILLPLKAGEPVCLISRV